MANETKTLMHCSWFEELLTDYLDRNLDAPTFKAVAEHALACPLCHSLLNEIKGTLALCREMAEPRLPVTRLEAKILACTTPEAAIHCAEFEEYLTDYLDGFLPAQVYHRWERHAVLCESCTDLPGEVVRMLGAVVAYKTDELPVPVGLHERILTHTIGAERRQKRASLWDAAAAWVQSIRLPISVPQLAPVAMMLLFAFMFFSQTVSADGSLTDVYYKGVELAEQTYKQGADAIGRGAVETQQPGKPINGATYVEDKK